MRSYPLMSCNVAIAIIHGSGCQEVESGGDSACVAAVCAAAGIAVMCSSVRLGKSGCRTLRPAVPWTGDP
jgi:hypothetical protein